MALVSNISNKFIASVLTLLCIAISANAYAASTFLLQLGTSETEEQAKQKWNDIKSKNPETVSKLKLHVAQVVSGPDNKITYRTQAGPVSSHSEAASMCSALQGNGADCYVVETALFAADEGAEDAAPIATATNAPPPEAAQSKKRGFFSRMFGNSDKAPEPVEEAPALEQTPPAELAQKAVPVESVTSEPAAPMAVAEPSPIAVEVDRGTVPAPGVGTPPAPETAKSIVQDVPAAGNHESSVPAPVTPPKTGKLMGYLGYLPPESEEPKAAPAPVAEVAPVAPPMAPPEPPQTSKSGFLGYLSGNSENPKPTPLANPHAVGTVKVAEAIRVPVGSGKSHKKIVVANLPEVHGIGGLPSQKIGKAYWAQLSYFADEDQARGFYDEFRTAYPQFSDGVRVRVTHPYAASARADRVSLRVGPFEGTQDTRTICTAAHKQGLHCTVVRDLGTSSAIMSPHSRSAYHSQDDYRAPSLPNIAPFNGDTGGYWVQLGSYPTSGEAWDEWKTMQDENKRLLAHVQATVTQPGMSSAARSLSRLRAGPFMSESSANTLCSRLEQVGRNCVVVSDK